MNESKTPETDAGYKAHYAEHENNRKLCERLERERDEARDTIARLEGRACLVCGASEPCELKTHEYAPCTFDPSPVDAARQFMRERDEAKGMALATAKLRLADIELAIAHLGQIYGLLEERRFDEASDYCRGAAESWTQDIAELDAILAKHEAKA